MKLFFTFIAFMFSSCQPNMLTGLSSRTTDEYLVEEARKANNELRYDSAIDILTNQISSDAKARISNKELLASAYAGKCGLNFLAYTTSLSESTSSTTAFGMMMQPFVGAEADPSSCRLSLSTMDSIGATAQRTSNENAFTAVTGMVLMGAGLRTSADIAPTVLGDGDKDVDVCSVVTDAQIDDIIIGFGYFAQNFSYLSADLVGGNTLTTLNNIVTACNSIPGSNCTGTDPASITPQTRDAIRDMLETQQYGIGDFDTGGQDINIPAACP